MCSTKGWVPSPCDRHDVYSGNDPVVGCPQYRRKVWMDQIAARLKIIFGEVDAQYGIHRLVRPIKGRSSCLLRQEFGSWRSRWPRRWTHSYLISSCGGAPLAIIKRYIEGQKNV